MPTETLLASPGELESTPLPRVILALAEKRFDGVLTLRNDSRERRFLFQHGAPVATESNLASDSLSHYLARASKLSRTEVRKVLSWTGHRGGHEGLAIVGLRLMEPASLFEAMKDHLGQALRETFGWRRGQYQTESDPAPDERLAPFRSDPLLLVQEGLEAYWDVERLFDALRSDLAQFPSPQPALPRILARLQPESDFDPTRWAATQSLAENLADTRLSPRCLATLWVLKECGALRLLAAPDTRGRCADTFSWEPLEIELVTQTPEDSPGPSRPNQRGDVFEKGPGDLREEIRRIQESSPGELDHYRLLGVDRNSPPAGLRKAYLRAAKRYHPDTLASRGLENLAHEAAQVFARITEAYEVLGEPKRRKDYDAGLRGEHAEVEADRIAHAEVCYRKAEVLLRMGNFSEAVQYLRRSVDLWPQEPAFHSALGWALYKMTPSDPAAAHEALEHAMAAAPDDQVTQFRLGVVGRELAKLEDPGAPEAGPQQELEPNTP